VQELHLNRPEIADFLSIQPPVTGVGSSPKSYATTWDRPEFLPAKRKGLKAYAATSSLDGSDRGGGSAVAGEQFHTDGRIDQVDFERRGGDRHSFVAAEHFWTFSLAVANARWDINSPEASALEMAAAIPQGAMQQGTDRVGRAERRRTDF
jgi:hypothetical protein